MTSESSEGGVQKYMMEVWTLYVWIVCIQDGGEAEAALDNPNISGREFAERAKYIPLRLSQEERRLLRLLEASLSVSEYTNQASFSGHTFQRLSSQMIFLNYHCCR